MQALVLHAAMIKNDLPSEKDPKHTISGTVNVLSHGLMGRFRIMSFQSDQDVTMGDPFCIAPSRKNIQTLYIFQHEDQLIVYALVLRQSTDAAMKGIVRFDHLAHLGARLVFDGNNTLQGFDVFGGNGVCRTFRGEAFQQLPILVSLNDVLNGNRTDDIALVLDLGEPFFFSEPIAGLSDRCPARLALRRDFDFRKKVTRTKAAIQNPALEEPVHSIYFAALFRL